MTPEQRTHAIIHNAADRALSIRGYWVPLGVRTAITETVLTALAEHGLVVVARDDLAETVEDAHTFNDVMLGGDDAATARLDRLHAALSGTLHPPQSPESVSAPPATPEHAGTRPNPSSTRTSPHMSDTNHTRNPRNEES